MRPRVCCPAPCRHPAHARKHAHAHLMCAPQDGQHGEGGGLLRHTRLGRMHACARSPPLPGRTHCALDEPRVTPRRCVICTHQPTIHTTLSCQLATLSRSPPLPCLACEGMREGGWLPPFCGHPCSFPPHTPCHTPSHLHPGSVRPPPTPLHTNKPPSLNAGSVRGRRCACTGACCGAEAGAGADSSGAGTAGQHLLAAPEEGGWGRP